MNKYTITFPFKGEWFFVYMTSNQLANAVLDDTDDFLDFKCHCDGQDFLYRIHHQGKDYDVAFGYKSARFFNVYNVDDEGGVIEEKNIPWLLLKIENENKETIYNLTDNV